MISLKGFKEPTMAPSPVDSKDKEFCVECYTELYYYPDTLPNVKAASS